ncbi:MAG: response regulator [Bdellovibrionota bacterium]
MAISKMAEPQPRPSIVAGAKSCTILIADDEADLREAIAFDFKRRGYQVLTAADGREALRLVSSQKVDLVISDIHMPNLDGIDLLAEIKKQLVTLPVFLFIGCSSEKDLSADHAYALGADGVFSKPFDRHELFRAVGHALLPLEVRLKRQAPPSDVILPVGVRFLKSAHHVQTSTINLGRGGMFVALQEIFPEPFETVEFRLQTPASPEFDLTGNGIVRWVRQEATEGLPTGCGIAFSELDPVSLKSVIGLVDHVKHKSFIPRH